MNPSFRFSFFLATGALRKIVPLKVSATESNRTSSLPRYFRNHGRSLSGTEKTNCRCGTLYSFFRTESEIRSRYFFPQEGQNRDLQVNRMRT